MASSPLRTDHQIKSNTRNRRTRKNEDILKIKHIRKEIKRRLLEEKNKNVEDRRQEAMKSRVR